MFVMKNAQLRMSVRLQHVAAMQGHVVSSHIRCQKQSQHIRPQGCGKESPFFSVSVQRKSSRSYGHGRQNREA